MKTKATLQNACLLIILLIVSSIGFSQDTSLQQWVNKGKADAYIKAISDKSNSLSQAIENKAIKTLQRLNKAEQKLQQKLARKNPAAAKQLFDSATPHYQSQLSQIKDSTVIAGALKEYIPALDSLHTALQYLQSLNPQPKGIQTAIHNIQTLQQRLQQSADIKKAIKARKAQLRQVLEQQGMVKELKKINQEAYYYQQQLQEYKSLLQQPDKLEKKAWEQIRKSNAFKDFMKKNSQLAALFRMPDNYGSPQSLAGLQTRTQVQALLQQRLSGMSAAGSANPQQYIQQQVQQAQQQLNKLKDKIRQAGGNSSDAEVPDFKPNHQRTKSFKQRLVYGLNVQTEKQSNYFPVTTNLGLSLGYKLNDNGAIGLGLAYKLGWGQNWNKIKLTHEGIGLRSYIDWKLKGSFYIAGGYEQNHNQSFRNLQSIQDISLWRQSGLIGLSKKFKLPATKNGKTKTQQIQLLYDFMHTKDGIRTPALLFRMGWEL